MSPSSLSGTHHPLRMRSPPSLSPLPIPSLAAHGIIFSIIMLSLWSSYNQSLWWIFLSFLDDSSATGYSIKIVMFHFNDSQIKGLLTQTLWVSPELPSQSDYLSSLLDVYSSLKLLILKLTLETLPSSDSNSFLF